MKKYLPILITLITSFTNIYGQKGHFGKRLIVKTNLLNGRLRPFNNIDLEYVVGKTRSITCSFYSDKFEKQFNYFDFIDPNELIKNAQESFTYSGYSQSNEPTVNYIARLISVHLYAVEPVYKGIEIDKSTIRYKNRGFSIGYRFYLNPIKKSPSSFYIHAGLALNNQEVQMNIKYPSIINIYTGINNELPIPGYAFIKQDEYLFTFKNLTNNGSLGIGYQYIFNKSITIDILNTFGFLRNESKFIAPREFYRFGEKNRLNRYREESNLQGNWLTHIDSYRNGRSGIFGSIFIKIGFFIL